jgi:hypothetical protein
MDYKDRERWRDGLVAQIWSGEEGRRLVTGNMASVVYTAFLCNLQQFPEGGEYRRVAEIANAALMWLAKEEVREVVRITKPPFVWELTQKGTNDAG